MSNSRWFNARKRVASNGPAHWTSMAIMFRADAWDEAYSDSVNSRYVVLSSWTHGRNMTLEFDTVDDANDFLLRLAGALA